MPGQPSEQQSVKNTKEGPVVIHAFILQPNSGAIAYGVTFAQFPEAFHPTDVGAWLERTHQLYAVKYKGQIVDKKFITLDGNPGIETETTWGQGHQIMRSYWVKAKGRFYFVGVIAFNGALLPANTAEFLDSFRLLRN